MKVIIATMAFVMLSQAQAQTEEPKQEQAAAQSQTAPIYIMNSQQFDGSQESAQIQSQPTTIVQDTPLVPSVSTTARKKRQSVEADTEDGIVTALEKARLEDELRRREKFNSAIAADTAPAVIAPAPVAPVAPVAAPAPVVAPVVQQPVVQVVETIQVEKVEPKKEEPQVDIRSEVRAALAESMPKAEEKQNSFFVSGLVGFGHYPDVRNIRGNMSAGFSMGMVTSERLVVEGSFLYGNYELEDLDPYTGGTPDYPRIVDLRQYNFTAGVKYQLLPAKIKPTVGALAGYTRRTYSEWDFDFQTTDALDVGLSAGLDVDLTNSFTIGVDFRYMTNLANRKETDYRESFVYPTLRDEVESLDYYTTTLTGKFTF